MLAGSKVHISLSSVFIVEFEGIFVQWYEIEQLSKIFFKKKSFSSLKPTAINEEWLGS